VPCPLAEVFLRFSLQGANRRCAEQETPRLRPSPRRGILRGRCRRRTSRSCAGCSTRLRQDLRLYDILAEEVDWDATALGTLELTTCDGRDAVMEDRRPSGRLSRQGANRSANPPSRRASSWRQDRFVVTYVSSAAANVGLGPSVHQVRGGWPLLSNHDQGQAGSFRHSRRPSRTSRRWSCQDVPMSASCSPTWR
jgi:hypothetical protein